MIDSEKIAQIRSKADIVRIVGTHVQLRKQGHRFTGLCPFHGEKSPSFSVSGDKGLFYCFGCHARGDVFSFVEQIQGLDFLSVARWLAKEVGVELEPESPVEAAKRKLESGIAEINRYVLTFFQHELWAKDGGVARKYLESRAIPEEQAKERGLGYGGNPGKLLAFLAAKKITIERAREAGLLNEQGDRSLFDERLIFPIVDQNGRIAGFGGRWLGDTKIDGERTRPKYVNTRESPLFSKRTLLYGWDVAQPTVRRLKRVTICEGYTDVLACQRAGIEDAVAALGTAFTAEHAALVKRLANDAIILLDSDAAGDRASKEAAEKCVNAGLKTLIAPLPAGDDPDSIVRKSGPQALEAFVKGARPAIEHFIDRAFAAPDMAVEDKARAAQNLWPLFKALGQSLERDLYMAQLANKVGVDTQQLEARLQEAEREERKKRPKTESRYADGRAQRADYRGPSGGRRFPTADGRSPSADHRGPRADGQPREDRFSDDDGPPPDDSYAPPPGWDGNSGPLPDGRSPMADHRRPGAPAREPPKPMPADDELRAIMEVLLFPTLRPRLSELSALASELSRPVLEDLATSADPAQTVLERHGIGVRWQKAAEKAGQPAPGHADPDEDSNQEERAARTFQGVLDGFERRSLAREKDALEAAIKAAEERGEPTTDLEHRRKDLTLRRRKLKRPG